MYICDYQVFVFNLVIYIVLGKPYRYFYGVNPEVDSEFPGAVGMPLRNINYNNKI